MSFLFFPIMHLSVSLNKMPVCHHGILPTLLLIKEFVVLNGLAIIHHYVSNASLETTPWKDGYSLTRCSINFEPEVNIWYVSSISRIHGSSIEMGGDPLTITFYNPLREFLLPPLTTLSSAGLDVLFLRVKRSYQGCNNNSIHLEDETATKSFGGFFLMPLNQQAEKRVTLLAGIVDPNFKEQIRFLLQAESREDYFWNWGESLRCLLLLLYLIVKVNKKPLQTKRGRTTVYSNTSGMKVCVASPIREQIEVLADVKRNMEHMVAIASLQDGAPKSSPPGIHKLVCPLPHWRELTHITNRY